VKRANFDVQLHIRESVLAMAVMDLRGSIVSIAPECLHFCRGTDWRRAPCVRATMASGAWGQPDVAFLPQVSSIRAPKAPGL